MLEEWKAIIKKPILWISMIGLALIPALYNLIFLSSMWDPYGQINNLPVAIVNQDKPATYQGQTFTIGDDMVDNMKETKALDYHFVTENKAKRGLEKGDYYLVITLPKNLSDSATSILTETPKPLEIKYQTSSGHSFVASKMADSAMSSLKQTVSQNLTETYTKALFKNMASLSEGLDKASHGGHQLADGSKSLSEGSQSLSDNLAKLAQATLRLTDGTETLENGLARYVEGVGQAAQGSTQLVTGTQDYTAGVDKMASGAGQLASKSDQLRSGASQLAEAPNQMQDLVDGSQQLTTGLQELAQKTILTEEQVTQLNQLSQGLEQLNTSIQAMGTSAPDLSGITASLTSIGTEAQSIFQSAQANSSTQVASIQATAAYQSLSPEAQSELLDAVSNTAAGQAEAQNILVQLSALQSSLQSLQAVMSGSGLSQLQTASNQLLPAAATQLTNLSGGLNQVNQAVTGQILPGSQAISQGVTIAQGKLAEGTSALSDGINHYTAGVGALSDGSNELSSHSADLRQGTVQLQNGLNTLTANSGRLLSGSNQLLTGALQLSDGAGQLNEGGQRLSDGMDTLDKGISTLTKGLTSASDKLATVIVGDHQAETLSNPVSLQHTELDQVETNGIGMAPYMMSVALMVLALSTNMIFTKTVSGKEPESRLDWISRKLAVNGLIALVAATLLYFAVHWIGLTANHEWKTYLMTLLASATFMAMVTALYTWHERLGAFASIILLLLQLGSSAGTYPLPLSNSFFQTLHPFLPMSYTVSGLRQTISMTGDIGHDGMVLSLFLIAFVALGAGIFKRQSDRLS